MIQDHTVPKELYGSNIFQENYLYGGLVENVGYPISGPISGTLLGTVKTQRMIAR